MGLLIGIVIAGFVAFWVYGDAQKRGNSGAWAFGVFVMMIIFLPLYLIVRNPLPAPVYFAPTMAAWNASFCPACGTYSTPGSAFCGHCGAKLNG